MASDSSQNTSQVKDDKPTPNSSTKSKSGWKGLLIFALTTIVSSFAFEYIRHPISSPKCEVQNTTTLSESLKFAIYGKSPTEEHLRHVIAVLERIGYSRVPVESGEWDLLWAHDYPFRVLPLKSLKRHQRVNHLPGCGFLTNKVDLSTSGLPYLPRAFKLPSDKAKYLNYIESNPNKLFVEKHNEHRHIYIKPPSAINLDGNETFVQEYIQNPYLVDGHKFDMGVYVIITSIDPLRVYIYKGDILFRFCPVKYHPFDPKNVDKYVVGDDYLPTWQVPSLAEYYNSYGFGMKDSFDAYVRNHGQNPDLVWAQVEKIIAETIAARESLIVNILKPYKMKNFFEMMRFDLILDDSLTVHLMEANMSPNLSSAHFKPNSLLYEQILYSVMNLLEVGSSVQRSSLKAGSAGTEAMISTDKNIVVHANVCEQMDCANSCNDPRCNLCLPCLTGSEYDVLQKAYREHVHKTDTKRIFPRPVENISNYNLQKETKNLTPRNALMTKWFYHKCQQDRTWCS